MPYVLSLFYLKLNIFGIEFRCNFKRLISIVQVYDVTTFMDDHPGGDEVLLSATGTSLYYFACMAFKNIIKNLGWKTQFGVDLVWECFAGKDATNDFEDVGHSDLARDMMKKYYIGEIDSSTVPRKRTYIPPQQAPYNPDKTPEFVIKILQFLVPLLILGLAFAVRHFTKKDA